VKILEWTPEYAVQVAEIDREHQVWFDVVNRLHAAMLAGKGVEILGVLLAETTRYTSDHFAHEEQLMAAVDYPELRAHVQQHDGLRRQAREFRKRFERGEVTMTIELTLFLSAWIKQHTMTTDRQLGRYLSTCRRGAARNGSVRRLNPQVSSR
jgi:hemerythrin